MPGKRAKETVRRKRDYVTWMAVFLFFIIVGFELMVVLWLPTKLRSETIWEREVALEEMIALEDLLRAQLSSFKADDKFQEGEVALAKSCLDIYARYLREYKDKLNREQIREIYGDLKKIESIYYSRWKSRLFLIKTEKLDTSKFIVQLQKKAGLEIKPQPPLSGEKDK